MSNGYLIAAEADLDAAREIGDGFGLAVLDLHTVQDREAAAAALRSAANLGIVISHAAAQDEGFVALLRTIALGLANAQLIIIDADARAAFAFLPDAWPSMSIEEAYRRVSMRRGGEQPGDETTRAHPLPPTEIEHQPETLAEPDAPAQTETPIDTGTADEGESVDAADDDQLDDTDAGGELSDGETLGADDEPKRKSAEEAPTPPPSVEPPEPPPQVAAPEPAAPPTPAPAPQSRPYADGVASSGPNARSRQVGASAAPRASAPADATAFAPSKLRRGTPELVRIVIHQQKDLQDVIKAARKIDPRTEPAPQGMPIGDVAIGASIGVALEVRGGACEGALQRRSWTGEPIDFSFAVEAEADVKQVVFLARVFVNDAQIGVLAFMRKAAGPSKKPASPGDRARLKRHKRVFLSYSSKDRETVSAIATAYQMAGVEHFFDRTSLKSGEEWSPRLRREIERADLFHLCWSKSAAESEWVAKEAEHALSRRRKQSKPEITVQMLDGPPWAKHPPQLDAINFDDFVRAAIVGYARGDGES